MPYRRYPRVMIQYLIQDTVKPMNYLPATDGISDHISPLTMVTGRGAPDYRKMKIDFGAYAQVFEENQVTNNQDTRAIGCVALASYPNDNGKFPFLNLNTGRVIHRRQFTEIPITDLVINRVHQLAITDKQRNIVGGSPLIEWRPGLSIDDDPNATSTDHLLPDHDDLPVDAPPILPPDNFPVSEDTNAVLPPPTPNLIDDDDITSNMSLPPNSPPSLDADVSAAQRSDDISTSQRSNDDNSITTSSVFPLSQRSEGDDDGSVDTHENDISLSPDDDASPHHDNNEHTETSDNDGDEDTNHTSTPTDAVAYNTRNKKIDYGYRFANQMNKSNDTKSYETQFVQHHTISELSPMTDIRDTKAFTDYTTEDVENALKKLLTEEDSKDALKFVVHYMFTQMHNLDDPEIFKQMGSKKGINKFGKQAIDALMQEFTQIVNMDVFKGVDPAQLTNEQKKEALRAIGLIKLKRDFNMKGRLVADGRPHREKYDKTQRSSATCHHDSLMLTLLIDAWERRYVATGDVPCAYLHAFMRDFTLIKLEGESVDILCEIEPSYEKYVVIEKGKRVLYLRLNKALYGCVMSALLWYELFAKTLKGMGFEINPYDMCVANKTINDRQCTIVWYVDDIKVVNCEF